MLLSIITPVLNGDRFIRENIESIMQLNVPHEHIIVDGGSTDDTLNILKDYPHLVVLNQKERNGMYGAIDQGFEIAKGNILTWINSDDYILAEEYGEMVREMNQRGAEFMYSNGYVYHEISGRNEICRSSACPKFFLRHGILPFLQPASIYRKTFYRNFPLNLKYKITGDMDMFYRMAADRHAVFVRYNKPTVVFRKYGDSLGDNNGRKGKMELMEAGVPSPGLFVKAMYYILRRYL